jgi:hypothetical protein
MATLPGIWGVPRLSHTSAAMWDMWDRRLGSIARSDAMHLFENRGIKNGAQEMLLSGSGEHISSSLRFRLGVLRA